MAKSLFTNVALKGKNFKKKLGMGKKCGCVDVVSVVEIYILLLRIK